MKHQLQTIREFIESVHEGEWAPYAGRYEALTALAELERMAGEPVAWTSQIEIDWAKRNPGRAGSFYAVKEGPSSLPLYTAAPVAQQPPEIEVQCPVCSHKFYEWPKAQQPQYEAADMASAAAQGFRDGVASVAQQPQEIEVVCPVCSHTFYAWPGEHKVQQPQAEAVPKELLKYEAPALASEYDGFICDMALQHGAAMLNDEGSVYAFTQEQLLAFTKANRTAAPQQAEAVPAVTDAMVDAYLQANDAYWRETDTQPKSPAKWRNGNPKEATRVSLAAAIAAAPQQVEAVPDKEDFCYCNDEISLQIVSGGGAPEGLYGRVTLKVNGEYVNYVRADSWQETPMARALEFVARHKSSDWPERCQQMVDMARAALAAPQQAGAVPPGYVLVPVEPTEAVLRALIDCQDADPEDGPMGEADALYRAMLAAAQGGKP